MGKISLKDGSVARKQPSLMPKRTGGSGVSVLFPVTRISIFVKSNNNKPMANETPKYPDDHKVSLLLTLAEASEIADVLGWLYPEGPYGIESQPEEIVFLRRKLGEVLVEHGRERQFEEPYYGRAR
jgi:hypothetical protein